LEQSIEHLKRILHLFGQQNDGKDDEVSNGHTRQKKDENNRTRSHGLENGNLQEDSLCATFNEETLESTLSEKKANKSRKTRQDGDFQHGEHLETNQSQAPTRQTTMTSATGPNNYPTMSLKEALMKLEQPGTEMRMSTPDTASKPTKNSSAAQDSKSAMTDGVSATDIRIICESLFQNS